MVFHQKDLMIALHLPGISATYRLVDGGKAVNVMIRCHFLHHFDEDLRQHLCVVASPMVVEIPKV